MDTRKPTLDTSHEWRTIGLTWVKEERVCTRCNAIFLECNNLGQWKCFYHPRAFNGPHKGTHYNANAWDCCGRPLQTGFALSNNGCTPADHLGVRKSDGKDIPQTPVQMVLEELIENGAVARPCPDSVVERKNGMVYVERRRKDLYS